MMGLHQLITDYSPSYMELYVISGHPLCSFIKSLCNDNAQDDAIAMG